MHTRVGRGAHVFVDDRDGAVAEELVEGALRARVLALRGEALRRDQHLGARLQAHAARRFSVHRVEPRRKIL